MLKILLFSLSFSFPCSVYSNAKGPSVKPYAGVIDGGDIASVRYTAAALTAEIKDQTCICHQLNNLIKRIIGDYFEEIYLVEWRAFIKRIKQSKPFEDLWNECTTQLLGKLIMLQKDTPTRWSSTVMMLKKAFLVRLAVERMRIVTAGSEHQVLFYFLPFFFFFSFFLFFFFFVSIPSVSFAS